MLRSMATIQHRDQVVGQEGMCTPQSLSGSKKSVISGAAKRMIGLNSSGGRSPSDAAAESWQEESASLGSWRHLFSRLWHRRNSATASLNPAGKCLWEVGLHSMMGGS